MLTRLGHALNFLVNGALFFPQNDVYDIVTVIGNSCTMDIKGVLDLYYRGQLYVFPEGAARGNTIQLQLHTTQFQCGRVVLVNLIG